MHSTISSSGAAAYNPNNSRPADEDDRQISTPAEAEERNFSPVISETSQLLPNDHLRGSKERKLTLSATDVTKATLQVNPSKFVAKREPSTAVLNVESSTEVPANENNGDKTSSEILGYYQSRRAIPIRKSTSFAAAIVQGIDSGIPLSVLEFIGSWAKVEVGPAGITGFVRREFLTSVKKNESNVVDNSPSGEEISDAALSPLGSTS